MSRYLARVSGCVWDMPFRITEPVPLFRFTSIICGLVSHSMRQVPAFLCHASFLRLKKFQDKPGVSSQALRPPMALITSSAMTIARASEPAVLNPGAGGLSVAGFELLQLKKAKNRTQVNRANRMPDNFFIKIKFGNDFCSKIHQATFCVDDSG